MSARIVSLAELDGRIERRLSVLIEHARLSGVPKLSAGPLSGNKRTAQPQKAFADSGLAPGALEKLPQASRLRYISLHCCRSVLRVRSVERGAGSRFA